MAEENQIGGFIAQLRKEKELTQKQLALQLGVTDKAVSKWERSMGYPDITMLPKLAAALGVTTGELLNGARESAPAPVTETLVVNTLNYVDKVERRRRIDLSRVILALITLLGVVAIGVCMICDFAPDRAFTWTVYPAASIVFGWLVLAPLLYFRRSRITLALVSVSLFLPPFLFLLNSALGGGWFFPVALPCALASLAWTWLCFLCQLVWKNPWRTAAAGVALVPLLNLSIDLTLWRYTGVLEANGWDLLGAVLCLIAAALLFWKSRPIAD